MPGNRMPQRSRVVFALLGVALILVLALAAPPPAQAQERGNRDAPSELWKTYPLDPSNGNARIRKEKEVEQETGISGGDARDIAKQPAPVAGRDSDMLRPLALLGLSLVGLLLLLLVARPAARLVPSFPGSVARFSSALASPVRSVASAPRPRRRSGSRGSHATSVARAPRPTVGARSRASSGTGAPRAASRAAAGLGSRLVTRPSRRLRALGVGAASLAIAPFRLLRRVATGVAFGVWDAAALVSSKRYHIMLYTVAVLAAASLGVVVSLFLNGA